MRLIDLDQTIFVPIVDETRDGVEYEMEMTVGEMFDKFLVGFQPEIVDAVPVTEWISVKDELPSRAGRYLVCVTGLLANLEPYVKTAYYALNLMDVPQFNWEQNPDYDRPGWYNGDGEGDWEETTVIYWMPMPEPPKEDA